MPDARTHFLVTGLPRAGTNLVLHALADHPAVVAYNELFNVHRILWGSTPVDAEQGEHYLALRNTRPLAFLDAVLNPDLPEIRAVGFKLFYMQGSPAECANFRLVWPYLRGLEGLKVVDVVRGNRLAQAVSWIKARRSRVWVVKNQERPDPQQPLSIPVAELNGYFLWFDEMSTLRNRLLEGMDVLAVGYEDLAADFTGQMVPIQEYLGVSVRRMPPRTVRQRTLPISQALANYAELREYFAGTPHFRYFEMAEENTRRLAAAT